MSISTPLTLLSNRVATLETNILDLSFNTILANSNATDISLLKTQMSALQTDVGQTISEVATYMLTNPDPSGNSVTNTNLLVSKTTFDNFQNQQTANYLNLNNLYDYLDNHVDIIDTSLNLLSTTSASHTTQLSNTATSVNNLNEQMTLNTGAIDKLDGSYNLLKTAVNTTLPERISVIDGSLNLLKTAVNTTLPERIGVTDGSLNLLKTTVTSNNNNLTGRIDSLTDKLDLTDTSLNSVNSILTTRLNTTDASLNNLVTNVGNNTTSINTLISKTVNISATDLSYSQISTSTIPATPTVSITNFNYDFTPMEDPVLIGNIVVPAYCRATLKIPINCELKLANPSLSNIFVVTTNTYTLTRLSDNVEIITSTLEHDTHNYSVGETYQPTHYIYFYTPSRPSDETYQLRTICDYNLGVGVNAMLNKYAIGTIELSYNYGDSVLRNTKSNYVLVNDMFSNCIKSSTYLYSIQTFNYNVDISWYQLDLRNLVFLNADGNAYGSVNIRLPDYAPAGMFYKIRRWRGIHDTRIYFSQNNVIAQADRYEHTSGTTQDSPDDYITLNSSQEFHEIVCCQIYPDGQRLWIITGFT